MKLFLSYASKYQTVADEISLALTGAGHEVIFDGAWLKPGDDYNRRIRDAFDQVDGMVFLITPEAVQSGSYALTEMTFAREKWPHPERRVLPVMLRPTPLEIIPPYLRAVTILRPEGNVAAEVASALGAWASAVLDEADRRKARVTVHIASFESRPLVPAAFVNITNLSENRDIVITHVWFEATPRVFAVPTDRPLPVRLKPDETWETWIDLRSLPSAIQGNPFGMARVRLSTGHVFSSVENVDVPERGFVPGGPITSLGDE
jgi:TIR domain